MSLIKKVSEHLKNALGKQNKKKIIENCLIVIIIGVIAIIGASTFLKKDNSEKDQNVVIPDKPSVETLGKNASFEDKEETEKRIEKILSQIDGAGDVDVMITYVSGKEIVPAYDSKKTENGTEERDSGGGTRNIKQNDSENKVVFEEGQGGGKKPIVLKEIQPTVKGVVVVADGATDTKVVDSLSRAVQVLVDVPIHKIQVFERKK
ncbi:MAG: stage III sporulation protein AG [Clostridia bacterium]|nr:stage III sporulation protein AG [Clostridia bacterium]